LVNDVVESSNAQRRSRSSEAQYEWLEGGRRVLLVTVVKTGKFPRRRPMLAVRDDGLVEVPYPVLHRGRHSASHPPRWPDRDEMRSRHYGVSADEARRFGLPCGAPSSWCSSRCRATRA